MGHEKMGKMRKLTAVFLYPPLILMSLPFFPSWHLKINKSIHQLTICSVESPHILSTRGSDLDPGDITQKGSFIQGT